MIGIIKKYYARPGKIIIMISSIVKKIYKYKLIFKEGVIELKQTKSFYIWYEIGFIFAMIILKRITLGN